MIITTSNDGAVYRKKLAHYQVGMYGISFILAILEVKAWLVI